MTIVEEVTKAREESLNKLQKKVEKSLEKIKEAFIKEQEWDLYSKRICFEVIWIDSSELVLRKEGKYEVCLIKETITNASERVCILDVLKKKLEEEGLKIDTITTERIKISILL